MVYLPLCLTVYRSCKHLDGKHTIFGKLVGGMETLNAMERIGTDNKVGDIRDDLITHYTYNMCSGCSS